MVILKISYPQLVGFYLLHRGSTKLVQAEQQLLDNSLVNSAISDLQKATTLLPSDPLPWRRLAQAFQRAGRMDDSIKSLQRASLLGSLLAKKDLMLLYQTMGLRDEQLEREFNFDLSRCITIGDDLLNQGDGIQAKEWYLRAVHLWPERSNDLLFRRWVASVQSNDEGEMASLSQIIPDISLVHLDGTDITVDGERMHWIPSGEPLNYPHRNDPRAIFWSNGRGSLFVFTEKQGEYLVQATVSNLPPPPIEMAFGMNGKILHRFSLSKGDNSWDTVEFVVRIESLINTIDFWFLNDGWSPENNVDRNAMIRRIRIVPIQ